MMNNLGIYIHIPFCAKKCDYCDFLSAPSDKDTMESYVKALIKEIKLSRDKMKEYLVDTIFIGGGTPSILEGKLIYEIMDSLRENCKISSDAEITIECNPGTVTEEKFSFYRQAGINRLSFGLQSADNNELKAIGRIHSFEDFAYSFEIARACGFDNINVDIMSALPGQSIESYRETIEKVLKFRPEHISAYSLIVEDGTEMKKRVEAAEKKGASILPDEDEEREMYYLTKALLKNAGYCRYEISNYAKIGKACRHNIGYWERKEYLGFGIGAASLYREERYNNISDLNSYIKELSKSKLSLLNIEENMHKLSREEQMEEFMFLGLRMCEGVDKAKFTQLFNVEYSQIYGEITNKLVNEKLLIQTDENVRLTDKGIDISNYVMSEFLF